MAYGGVSEATLPSSHIPAPSILMVTFTHVDYSVTAGIRLALSLHLRRIPPLLAVAVADIPKDIVLPWAGQADILKDITLPWAGQAGLPLFEIQPHRQVPTPSKQSCAYLTPRRTALFYNFFPDFGRVSSQLIQIGRGISLFRNCVRNDAS